MCFFENSERKKRKFLGEIVHSVFFVQFIYTHGDKSLTSRVRKVSSSILLLIVSEKKVDREIGNAPWFTKIYFLEFCWRGQQSWSKRAAVVGSNVFIQYFQVLTKNFYLKRESKTQLVLIQLLTVIAWSLCEEIFFSVMYIILTIKYYPTKSTI